MPTNEERIERARAAIAANTDNPDTFEDDFVDLLTNLRHAAAEEGVDFTRAIFRSAVHFEEERD